MLRKHIKANSALPVYLLVKLRGFPRIRNIPGRVVSPLEPLFFPSLSTFSSIVLVFISRHRKQLPELKHKRQNDPPFCSSSSLNRFFYST